MNFRFISTLRFMKVIGNDLNDFDLLPGITVVRQRDKIKKALSKELKENSGLIEYDHLNNANHILYGDFKNQVFESTNTSQQALFVWLLWLDMLVFSSWLVKDNSMHCEMAFCNKYTRKNFSEWSNNSLMTLFTTSSGVRWLDTEFSKEELIEWERKNDKINNYLDSNSSSMFDSFIDSKYSRYGRAFSFIKSARRELNPAMKIAHYCSALESLFSTDNAELSHKLSERVSIFLKDFGYDPLEVFDDIKGFYGIRSKVTHGDSLKSSKVDNLPNESSKFDSYLRKIMNEILESDELMKIFDGDKNSLELFFKKKLLVGDGSSNN